MVDYLLWWFLFVSSSNSSIFFLLHRMFLTVYYSFLRKHLVTIVFMCKWLIQSLITQNFCSVYSNWSVALAFHMWRRMSKSLSNAFCLNYSWQTISIISSFMLRHCKVLQLMLFTISFMFLLKSSSLNIRMFIWMY